MSNEKPKIVIFGAGSLFFGRQAIWAVNHLAGLRGCTLSLVDTDKANLDRMHRLGTRVAELTGSKTRVEAYRDFRDALPGADFVVLSFSERNAHYRRLDCEISAKYGIRMCSGDTIGPGGLFRTLREFPHVLEIAREIEKACPDAWLINYINPSAIMGIGLMRHTKVKSFALCDSHHLPWKKEYYLKMIGEEVSEVDDFDLRIAGVNHFTWILKAELEGVDVTDRILEVCRKKGETEYDQGYAKARFDGKITTQLAEVFGCIPSLTDHTKEYVPYYQGRSALCEPIPPLSVFECDEREAETREMWREIDEYLDGPRTIQSFCETYKTDHATDIIETMVTGNGRSYYINRSNFDPCSGTRAVENLPDDAFLEIECDLGPEGPKPRPAGAFPLGLRAQQMVILDVHELVIEGIVREDTGLLLRALAMDPIVNSIATARAVMKDLYEAQKEVMPEWFRL